MGVQGTKMLTKQQLHEEQKLPEDVWMEEVTCEVCFKSDEGYSKVIGKEVGGRGISVKGSIGKGIEHKIA